MRRILGCLALVSAFALFGCKDRGSPPPQSLPPPVDCRPTLSECSTSTDCCGLCFVGFCMPSAQGGKCATTDDCQEPYVCVNRVCSAASCRPDLDVCEIDSQCCAQHCRGDHTCGANRAPVANAGPDVTVDKGTSVPLGGLSGDPDHDWLDYAWTLAVPQGSGAALTSTAYAYSSFVPDVVGVYTVSVTVSDGQYDSSDSMIVTAVNSAPVARAGTSRTAPRNTLVQLDATGSTDPNGDPLTFAWTLAGPVGSTAALSSATDPKPTFTPDLLGDYVATVTASDGELTSSAGVTITATNTAPVANITGYGFVHAGESVTLSAATSTDQNGDPLTFAWTLPVKPPGSAAVLTSDTGPTTAFTADLAGTYRVTVVASDGLATGSSWRQVQAYPHLLKLTHDVVGAAYSKATDTLVTISTTPSYALWILDPATEIERRVDLSAGPPLSVGVSADGLVAVVGRNGGVTEVDLAGGTVVTDCTTTWSDGTSSWNYDAASVAVGPELTLGTGKNTRLTRYAYGAPGSVAHRGDYTMALDLGTCTQQADWALGMYFDGVAAMRPVAGQFYVHDAWDNSGTFYVYTMPNGPLATRVPARPGYTTRHDFWFTEDGARMLVEYGEVYDSNPVYNATYLDWDLPKLGALGNAGIYDPKQLVLHADHSSARQQISIVPKNDYGETDSDTVLKWYFAPDGNTSSYAVYGAPSALPTIVANGNLFTPHGRYVFYRSDGTVRYVVMRTAPGTATTIFAVAGMRP